MSPTLVAALFHLPGVYLLTSHRPSRSTLRLNAVAAGLTVMAVVAGALVREPMAAFAAWAVGHVAWSAILGWRVHTGR